MHDQWLLGHPHYVLPTSHGLPNIVAPKPLHNPKCSQIHNARLRTAPRATAPMHELLRQDASHQPTNLLWRSSGSPARR